MYPFPTCSLVVVSTPVNARYWLVNVAPWKDSVGVFGNSSADAECVVPRLLNVPKRDSATVTGQRSAAQNGQYSAPM